MSRKVADQNLDELLFNEGYQGRLECSLTRAEFFQSSGVSAKYYYRNGLGVWSVSSISVQGLTPIIFGSPCDLEGAGCTVWFQASASFTEEVVAAVVCSIFGSLQVSFINPDTGEAVAPNYQALKKSIELPNLDHLGSSPNSDQEGRGVRGRKGLYEHVFISRQDLSEAQARSLIDEFAKVISDNGGKVVDVEYWGVKTMAYKINKNRKGHYSFLKTDAPESAVLEMERLMRLHSDVMRILTVKVEKFGDVSFSNAPQASSTSSPITVLRQNKIPSLAVGQAGITKH